MDMPISVGPRSGSDPANSAQEIAVLRAELRGLEEQHQQWAIHHVREHALIQEAVGKAEASVDKRLEGMNELRAQITSERAVYLTRAVYDAAHAELRSRVTNNTEAIIKLSSELSSLREDLGALKSGQEWLVRLVAGAVVTMAIAALFAWLRVTPM
jgi:hypothetical protein